MNALKTTTFASEPSHVSVPTHYSLPIGYLRAFVTLLVLGHHAALAYHPFAPPVPASLTALPRWWLAFPVVDSQRTTGFSLFVGFNDIFFMSLMFLLSGLFVWKSLEKKGVTTFVRDRLLRLGIPFLFAAAIVAPVAYYPAHLLTGGGRRHLRLLATVAVAWLLASRPSMVCMAAARV